MLPVAVGKVYLIYIHIFLHGCAGGFAVPTNSNIIAVKYLFAPDFDLGLCAGIDLQFSKKLHAEIRYVHGVTKIYRPYAPVFSSEKNDMIGYNRVLQSGLIYDFR